MLHYPHLRLRCRWLWAVVAAGLTIVAVAAFPPAAMARTSRAAARSPAQSPASCMRAGQPKPVVVLVHGAWADTSSWSGEVAELRAAGWDARAIANPLRGLTTDSEYVADYVKAIEGPVILVGHSYGGAVISQAAAGLRNVRALVYVDASAPAPGEANGSLSGASSVLSRLTPAQLFLTTTYPGAPAGARELYLKENIFVGQVRRLVAGPGQVVDTYLHQQSGRGVNAVAVVIDGGDDELAHNIAVHIAFTKPPYLSRDEVPEADIEAERATLADITRKEGKPEAALEKIVNGRMDGWFKDRVLLDQSYVKDEKQTIAAMLGSAKIVAFAQVVVGI